MKRILLCSLMLFIISFDIFAGTGFKGERVKPVSYNGRGLNKECEKKLTSNQETNTNIAQLEKIASIFGVIVGGTFIITGVLNAYINPQKNEGQNYSVAGMGVAIASTSLLFLCKNQSIK